MTTIEFYQHNGSFIKKVEVETPINELSKSDILSQLTRVEDPLAIVYNSQDTSLIQPRLLFSEIAFLQGVISGIEPHIILFGINDFVSPMPEDVETYSKVIKYNLLEGKVIKEWRTDELVTYIFSDENRVIATKEGGPFELKYLDASREPIIFSGHSEEVFALAVLESENLVASSSGDDTVKIWNLQTGECLETIELGAYPCFLSFPNAKVVIGSRGAPEFWLWSREKHNFLVSDDFEIDTAPAKVAVDTIHQSVIVVKKDGITTCYSLLDGKQIWSRSLADLIDSSFDFIFPLPELDAIALDSGKGQLSIINSRSGDIQTIFKGGRYYGAVIGVRKQVIITGGSEDKLCVLNVQTGECLALLVGHIHSVTEVMMMTLYSQYLVTMDNSGRVISWKAYWQNLRGQSK